MAFEIKHATQVNTGDWPDDPAYPIGSNEWNAALAANMATARFLGRLTAGAGAVEELTGAQVAQALQDEAAFVALTDGATVNIDWASPKGRTLVMAGNRLFANPTNVKPGTSRLIYVTGSSSTERTPSYASNYKGPLPEDTVTSTVGMLLTLTALSASIIVPTWKVVEL